MLELASLVVSTAANLALAYIVLTRRRRRPLLLWFSALALSLAIWPIFTYLSIHLDSGQLYYIRATMMFVCLMNVSFFGVAMSFAPKPQRLRPWQLGVLIYGVVVAGIMMTPLVFASVTIASNGYPSPQPGIGIPLFILDLVGVVGSGFALMVRNAKRVSRLERSQLRLVLIASVALYSLSIVFSFILPIAFKMVNVVAFGPIFTAIFAGVIGYAIVRHRLFDIRRIIARSLSYSFLIVVIAVGYVGIVQVIGAYFLGGYDLSYSRTVVNAVLAIVLALTFQRLRGFIEDITDRIFYRHRYDSQAVLMKFSTILVRESELEQLMKHSLSTICQELNIAYGQLMVFKDDKVYKIEHFGRLPKRLIVAPLLRRLDRSIIVADELDEGEYKDILESHDLRLSAVLKASGDTVGYLLLGDKLSGDIYSIQDVDLIGIMVKELAVAISNAQAYAEIQAFAATLQERVNHATGRLRVANRHLKELDRVKDEFISMASHQLRTPLTTIKGYLSMILEGDAGRITAVQREFTEYAFVSSERMVHLISDLLDVSRLSAGRFMIQPTPVDLGNLITSEVEQLEQHAKDKNVGLELSLPPAPLPVVMLDETKTRQVVMNFIDNAIYYTQAGSVMVTLTSKAGRVRLEVHDTGIGVPEAAKRHLFSKFFRADNAQRVRPDGTGLGLYLAKRVVEDQGGTILFSSVEGKGSMFGFELPLVPAPTISAKTKVNHG